MMWEILWPPLRILGLSLFLILAKGGYITGLTPDNVNEIADKAMDFIVVLVPALYALWAWFQARRHATPEYIVEKAAALPEVSAVVTTPELAQSTPDSPKVVS